MKTTNIFFVFLIFGFFFKLPVLAQNTKIDSLEIELSNHKALDTLRVNILNNLAYLYGRKNLDKAKIHINESEAIAKAINFEKGKARSIYIKAAIQATESNFTKGFEYYSEALELYKKINNKKGIAECLKGMGTFVHRNGKFKEALKYYKKSLILNEEIENTKQIPLLLNYIGWCHKKLGNYTEAISYYEKVIHVSEALNDNRRVSYSLSSLATIYSNQGNYPVALEYYNKSLEMAKSDADTVSICYTLANMGSVYFRLKNYDKTIENYEETLKTINSVNKNITPDCLNSLGLAYKGKKDYDRAYDYFMKAQKLYSEYNDEMGKSTCLNNIGEYYFELKDYKTSYQYYEQSKKINLKLENLEGLSRSFLGMANIYLNQKKYNQALSHALKSQQISVELKLIDHQRDASKLIYEIYKNKKQYKDALESHQQFKILNDSLFNKKNIEKIAQIEYEYKYKQALDSASIRELQLKETVTTTNKNLEKTQRNYLWAIIGVLLVSMILGSIIFYQKLKNVNTKTQNIAIEQKLLRSQMTPHFIFNSLSVLQGMILNKESKKSVHYLSKFSKLLRITLENSRDKTVSLSQELKAIQNYLALQNLENEAYQSTLLVEDTIDIPKFEVPPMLIQPFVENAIEHAFVDEKDEKKIDIRLTYSDKKLMCTIADNGIGYEAQKTSVNGQKKSLSTVITSERLKILSKDFNMEGSVKIEDRQKYNAQGTIVTLVIPHKIITVS